MIRRNQHIDNIYRTPTTYSPVNCIRLHASERDQPYSEHMWQQFITNIAEQDIRLYPDIPQAYDLLEQYTGIEQKYLTIYDGSDRALRNIFQIFVEPGSQVLSTTPCFPMYKVYTEMYQGVFHGIPYKSTKMPFFKLLGDPISDTNLVILGNPNSPIGDTQDRRNIEYLLDKCRIEGCMLVIDEAYIEFSNISSIQDLAQRHPNLIVVRTLSKAGGAAGIRIGYTVSTPENRELLQQLKSMNDITSMSIAWLKTMLNNREEVDKYINDVILNRTDLLQHLTGLGRKFIASQTNFIHVSDLDLDKTFVAKKYKILNHEYTRLSIPGNKENYVKLKENIND